MTTRINQDVSVSPRNVAPPSHRVTRNPATSFKSVLDASTLTVLDGVESAVRRLPGGEVLAAGRVRATGGIEEALARQSQHAMLHLSLQSQVRDENRYDATLSSTTKTRRDTVENNIGNQR